MPKVRRATEGTMTTERFATLERMAARRVGSLSTLTAAPPVAAPPAPPDAPPAAPDAAPAPAPAAPGLDTSGAPDFADGEHWRARMAVMDTPTGDGRQLDSAGASVRDLPLEITWQREMNPEHDGAVFVGNLTRCQIQGNEVYGFGTIDLAGENGGELWRILGQFGRFGVSVDLDNITVDFVFPDAVSIPAETPIDDVDEELFDQPTLRLMTAWRIAGLCATPLPAFQETFMVPNPALLPGAPVDAGASMVPAEDPMMPMPTTMPTPAAPDAPMPPAAALVASALDLEVAAAIPDAPPPVWFADPSFPGPMPFTICDDGRVFGHLALWGTCHTGFANMCETPPREPDYSYYRTGEVVCADGSSVPVGTITVGTGHADQQAKFRPAAAHYDDTGWAAADVAAGADAFGIWVSGSLRPGVSGQQIRALRASRLSGDWRKIGGRFRLIGALAVNVPGFPIPRASAGIVAGAQISLVAAGIVPIERLAQVRAHATRRLALEALDARMHRDNATRVAALSARVHQRIGEFGCGCGGGVTLPQLGHLVAAGQASPVVDTPATWRITADDGEVQDYPSLLAAQRARLASGGSRPVLVR